MVVEEWAVGFEGVGVTEYYAAVTLWLHMLQTRQRLHGRRETPLKEMGGFRRRYADDEWQWRSREDGATS